MSHRRPHKPFVNNRRESTGSSISVGVSSLYVFTVCVFVLVYSHHTIHALSCIHEYKASQCFFSFLFFSTPRAKTIPPGDG